MALPFSIDRWNSQTVVLWAANTGATLLLLRLIRLAFVLPEWGDLPARTRANPILLTDDDHNVLTLLQLMLERLGLSVVCTPSAEEALAMCRTMPISLVISDVMKPGMSGFELLKHLRADPATRHIPLMFLSAGSSIQGIHTAMQLGADDYLVKPISFQELGVRVCGLLARRGNWSAASSGDQSRQPAQSSD